MANKLYLQSSRPTLRADKLRADKAEDVVLAKAMEAYDGASNGNRTRGGMKKANDMYAYSQLDAYKDVRC